MPSTSGVCDARKTGKHTQQGPCLSIVYCGLQVRHKYHFFSLFDKSNSIEVLKHYKLGFGLHNFNFGDPSKLAQCSEVLGFQTIMLKKTM